MRILSMLFLIGFATSLWSQEPETIILENAFYLDIEKGSFEKANILIRYGVIQKISAIPGELENATVIDASSYYTIPGLFDSHIHLFQSGAIYTRPDVIDLTQYKSYEEEQEFLRENAGDLLRRYLRCGITSVIDIGGPMSNYALRDKYKDDANYSNLFLTGPLISTYQPPAFQIEDSPIIKVHNGEEARALVRKQVPYDPDFIKIWGIALPSITSEDLLEIMSATVEESRKNNLRVFVHATQLNTAKLAVKAGADVLVHSVANQEGKIDEEFVQMLKDSNVVYIPTLIVSKNYDRVFAEAYQPSEEDFNISNPFILGEIFDRDHLTEVKHFERWEANYPRVLQRYRKQDSLTSINLNLVLNSNNTIATGTDAGNIGTLHASSFYDEIEAMSEAGLSNLEIIRASTINGAKAVGEEDNYGSITIGKVADLVMLTKNPLEDIDHLKSVELVMKNGKVHDASELLQITPEILAQQQLNAYNAGDIDAFLEPYSDNVEIYNFPAELSSKGKEAMRKNYSSFFENTPNLHCELLNRIVDGNTVIDHERITGIPNMEPFTAIAIYKIVNEKISKVYFVR